jgi:AcrR family transcriptional regulator
MPPIPELEAIRKAQILEAALKTIAGSGSANVTMADIARAAGLSKGGMAHYYPSKNELFKAVLTEFFNRIFKRSEETMAQYQHPLEKILSFDWLYNLNDPDVHVGYPILFDFMAITVHDREYRALFHEWIEGWVVLLKETLQQGLDQGIFQDLDPDATARTVSAIYQGIATRWYLDRDAHSTEWAVGSFRKAITNLLIPYQVNHTTI